MPRGGDLSLASLWSGLGSLRRIGIIPRKRLDAISAIYFGLIVGLFLAYVGGLALTPFLMITDPEKLNQVQPGRPTDPRPHAVLHLHQPLDADAG